MGAGQDNNCQLGVGRAVQVNARLAPPHLRQEMELSFLDPDSLNPEPVICLSANPDPDRTVFLNTDPENCAFLVSPF